MAYTPVALYRKGAVRMATTREEELKLRWEGWDSEVEEVLPPREEITLPSLAAIDDVLTSLRGVAGGVAPLDGNSRIPAVYMPNDASSGSLEAHVLSERPHPVYDDMIDLTVILENGLV